MSATVYGSVAELRVYAGEHTLLVLTDRVGAGVVDEAVAHAALEEASSIVDSYIPEWLPLSSVPLVLRRHVFAIAVYSLANDMQTDDQRRRYEDAIKWLTDVSKGVASLGIPPAVESPKDNVGIVSVCSQPRRMSRNSLRGVM